MTDYSHVVTNKETIIRSCFLCTSSWWLIWALLKVNTGFLSHSRFFMIWNWGAVFVDNCVAVEFWILSHMETNQSILGKCFCGHMITNKTISFVRTGLWFSLDSYLLIILYLLMWQGRHKWTTPFILMNSLLPTMLTISYSTHTWINIFQTI